MRGTKRFATSESSLLTGDSNQSKRIMAGSPFDSQRAEPSQQMSVTTPQLDMQRAESSRQHVRALNTQFASWVQTQLQNHPDELWEDGAQDYLSHAASIMEKFSDVVNWLKANAAKGESTTLVGFQPAPKTVVSENKENKSTSLLGYQAAPKTLVSENKENKSTSLLGFQAAPKTLVSETNENKSMSMLGFHVASKTLASENKESNSTLSLDIPPITAANPPSSFGTSWNSGPLFNNKTPFSFGLQSSVMQSQNAVATNNDTSNDADNEDDVEQPSSPSVKKTKEKGVIVVHEVKCKLYVKSSDPTDKDAWKDRGTGQLSVKCKEGVSKGTRESKPTILIRNDVGKVVLNALLYPGIKTNLQKNSIVTIFHTSDGENSSTVVTQTCLIRMKSVEDRDKLAAIIQEYAPAA